MEKKAKVVSITKAKMDVMEEMIMTRYACFEAQRWVCRRISAVEF